MNDQGSDRQLQGTRQIDTDQTYDELYFGNVSYFGDDESRWSDMTFDTAKETLPASSHLQDSSLDQNKSNGTVTTSYERTIIDSDSIKVALSTSISMDFDILDPRHRNRDSQFDYFSSDHRLTQESLSHLQAAVSDGHASAVDNFVLSSMHRQVLDNASSSFDWEQASHDLRLICAESDRRRSSDETKYDEIVESAMVAPNRPISTTKLSDFKKRSCSAPQRFNRAFMVDHQEEFTLSPSHHMGYRKDFATSCPSVSSPSRTQFHSIRQPVGRQYDISEHLYSRFSADTSSDNESQSRLALARHSNRTQPQSSHEILPLFPNPEHFSAQSPGTMAPPDDLPQSCATQLATLPLLDISAEARAKKGCSCQCHSGRASHATPESQRSKSKHHERVQKHSPASNPTTPKALKPAIKTESRYRSVSHEGDPQGRLHQHHYQSEPQMLDRRTSIAEHWPLESLLKKKTSGKARVRPRDSVKSFRRFSSTLQLFSNSGSADAEAARTSPTAEGHGKMRKILGRVENKVDKFLNRLSADRRRTSDCPANCTTRPNRTKGSSSRGSLDLLRAARKSLDRSQVTTMAKGIY